MDGHYENGKGCMVAAVPNDGERQVEALSSRYQSDKLFLSRHHAIAISVDHDEVL
jgi:hypothetical protein